MFIIDQEWGTIYSAKEMKYAIYSCQRLGIKKNQKKIKKPLTFMSKDGNIIKSPRDTATKQ